MQKPWNKKSLIKKGVKHNIKLLTLEYFNIVKVSREQALVKRNLKGKMKYSGI